jgi:hypothetical protein
MNYLALALVPVFLLFAGWQYNDPDPLLWMTLYGITAYTAWRAYRGQSNPELLVVLLLLTAAWGLSSWLQMTAWEGFITESIQMKTQNQELAREAVGLWLCSAAFGLFLAMRRRRV